MKNFFKSIYKYITENLTEHLQILIVLVFITFFGFIAMPNMSFPVGDRVFSFPTLDNISPLGTFFRGPDLFYSKVFRTAIDWQNESLTNDSKREYLNQVLDRVTSRLHLAGLNDVKVFGEIENDTYYLSFEFPDYYRIEEDIITLATMRGEVTFSDPSNLQQLSIKDSDISSNIDLVYTPALQSHLKMSFAENKRLELQVALMNQYFYMNVDGLPLYQMFQYELSDQDTNSVRGLPTTDIAFRDTYINLTRVLFNETDLMQFGFEDVESVGIVDAEYANIPIRYIAVAFASIFVILSFVTLYRYGFRKAIAFVLMSLTYLTLVVSILKLTATPISLPMILMFSILSILSTVLIWPYINVVSGTKLNNLSRRTIQIGIILFTFGLVSGRFISDLGRYSESIMVIISFGITLIVCGYFNFKVLANRFLLSSKNEK